MRILSFIILSTFVAQITSAQNIYSALQLNENREYRGKKPKKIVETNTFYNTSGKQVDKNVKTFDDSGMLLIEERYDEDGTLNARLTYTNDTTNKRKLTRVFERWNRFGFSKETAFYSYDVNHYLIGTTDKDANENIIRQSDLICNDKGHPIQLSLFDGSGNPFGKEIATYLYNSNKVATSVISNEGRTLSSDTTKISYSVASLFPMDGEIYNENGDLGSWPGEKVNSTKVLFEEDYIYDSFGNCIENKIYKVIIKPNGKTKREIDRIFKKEYTY